MKNVPSDNRNTGHIPKIQRLVWRIPPPIHHIHAFIYSKKSLALSLLVSLVVYLLLVGQPEILRRTIAVFVFAALCWVLEVFPYPITGLMIPVACALLGIFSPQEAFIPFSNLVIFLLLGGLVLAEALRKHQLDRRLALYVVKRSRGSLDRMFLLLMGTVWLLSMWLSNTVAVAVLLPAVLTIIASIPGDNINIRKKMLLGVIMSSTIGGMAMLTGTPPNLIAAAALADSAEISFGIWAYYGLPVSLGSLLLSYTVLNKLYPSPETDIDVSMVAQQDSDMGPLTGKQKLTLGIFLATVILWFLGEQIQSMLGLPPSIASAAVVSILCVLMLFGTDLLDMGDISTIRFDLVFLVGGGLVLGQALIVSGAAAAMGGAISNFSQGSPVILLMLLFMVISVLLTNFMSNTATISILAPIAMETSRIMDISPVPLVIGTALASSIAFLTPVATTSTAIVFSTDMLDKRDLMRSGILIAGAMILLLLFYVYLIPTPA